MTGLISPELLGQTLAHEHLLIDLTWARKPKTASEMAFFDEPLSMHAAGCCRTYNAANHADLLLGSVDTAVEELRSFKAEGGGTLVELTAIGIGRDPVGLARIARASSTNVVMGTAFYVAAVHPPEMEEMTIEQVADVMVSEVVYGVALDTESPSSGEGASHSLNTGIRAGIIGEVGCSWPLHPNEIKVLQAAAFAQRCTGAAITVHPGRDETAPMQILEILRAAGADLTRTVMCHVDRTVFQRETLRALAETGCYLEYDLFGNYQSGWYPFNPEVELLNDAGRVEIIKWLCEQGWGRQVLIAQDICNSHRLAKWGGHGYGYILQEVVPRMRSKGVTEQQIEDFLVNNPKTVLTFVEPQGPRAGHL